MGIQELIHAVLHTLKEFGLMLPFLFLSYLLMEWMEHNMQDKTRHAVERAGKWGPLVGGLLGAVPQCGFAGAASGLYAGRVITLGTLFSVFLSTSDEMLAVSIAHIADGSVGILSILKVLGIKVLLGMVFGFAVDLLFQRKEAHHHHIGKMCESHHCGCEKGIVVSSVRHTLEVGIFLFLVILCLNLVTEWVGGEEVLASILSRGGILSCFVAPLVGMIPGCVSSVVITELYLSGALSVGALYGGLLAGSGVGLLILFRSNRPHKENILIALGLYGVGTLVALLVDVCGLDFLGL